MRISDNADDKTDETARLFNERIDIAKVSWGLGRSENICYNVSTVVHFVSLHRRSGAELYMGNESIFTQTPEGVVVNVRAQPRSSRAGIDGVMGDALKVRIRSAPVDGKANKELIETLADAFGLPKSRVTFKSGETSKTKRILLKGMSVEEIEKLI